MRRARPTRSRLAQCAALALAILALALALRSSGPHFAGLAAAGLLALAIPFFEWADPPAPLLRVLPRMSALLLLSVALLAWFSRSLSLFSFEPSLLPSATAPFLVPIAIAFALAPRAFGSGRTLVPATIGVLVLAGLDPAPAGYRGSFLPFLRGAEHSAFGAIYLGLALAVLAALWIAALSGSGPRWHRSDVVRLLAAGAFALALAATGVVGLPMLQPRVERAVASMLDQGATGLSNESALGEFAELGVSNRRILDLRTSNPSRAPSRLRAEVFTAFDGRRWTAPDASVPADAASRRSTMLQPMPPPPNVGPLVADVGSWFRLLGAGEGAPTEIRVVQAEVSRWPLMLPKGVAAVTLDAPYVEVDRLGAIRRPAGIPSKLYGALWPSPLVPSEPLSNEERRESLELPKALDPRVVALARRLASRHPAPADRVRAVVGHLRSAYRYTLRPGAFRTKDPLAEFLFEKKAGYCEYFASAAVVLLRLADVPARFVKGLSLGAHTDAGGGLHVVRERDAHAWIEVWLPESGWVEEDPTPPAQFAEAHPPAPRFERLAQRARASLGSAWAFLTARGPIVFLRKVALGVGRLARRLARSPVTWFLLAAIAAGRRLWRVARRRRSTHRTPTELSASVPADLRALVRELERRWTWTGRARPAGRGLLEHARRVAADSGPLSSTVAEAGPQIAAIYYRSRFGGDDPAAGECAALIEALDRRSPTR